MLLLDEAVIDYNLETYLLDEIDAREDYIMRAIYQGMVSFIDNLPDTLEEGFGHLQAEDIKLTINIFVEGTALSAIRGCESTFKLWCDNKIAHLEGERKLYPVVNIHDVCAYVH